jgi:prepilin-type N-terminal cleavage/methylation domain-containing protein
MADKKGFTLIEIIAVLIILGILAFFAAPRLIDLTSNARARASKDAIAQAKSMLSTAYAKYLLENKGKIPAGSQLLSLMGVPSSGNLDLGPDFRVTFSDEANMKRISIVVSRFQGKNVPPPQRVSDFWYYPN